LYKRTVNLSFVPKEARDTISRQRGKKNGSRKDSIQLVLLCIPNSIANPKQFTIIKEVG
jgi:hypothetical protein